MADYFTQDQQNTFYNSQPAKTIGGAALLFNEEGELLLVKPSYKLGWSAVGGICEKDESLLEAVIRETKEETGLMLQPADFTFAGMRYVKPRKGRNEDMQAYFKAVLRPEQCKAIVLQNDELEEFVFVSMASIMNYADTPRIQAIAAVFDAASNGQPFYVENETRIL